MARKHNPTPEQQPDATAKQLANDIFDNNVTNRKLEAEFEKASDAEVQAAIDIDMAADPLLPPISPTDLREIVKEAAEEEAS